VPAGVKAPEVWALHGVYPTYVAPTTPFQRAFADLFVTVSADRALSRRAAEAVHVAAVMAWPGDDGRRVTDPNLVGEFFQAASDVMEQCEDGDGK